MTKKLEELFNLPSQDQDLEEQIVPEYVPLEQAQEQLDLAKKIDNALPQISGVDTTDQDMDIYADKAERFDDLN